jgi:integrase/recombinase XerC
MLYKDDFLSYLRFEKRYSPHTVASYNNDLKQFDIFCMQAGSDGFVLDSSIIRMWVVSLLDQGISPRSVNRKLSTLKSFARYLMRQGIISVNPLNKVLKPKMSKRIPAFIDEEKLNQFLDNYEFGEDYEGLRNQLIIELLYQTGMRRSELIGLKTSSINFADSHLRVLGKRNKERIYYLPQKLNRFILNWFTGLLLSF